MTKVIVVGDGLEWNDDDDDDMASVEGGIANICF